MKQIKLKGVSQHRNGVWIALGMIGAICGALYPIVIYPYLHIDEYSQYLVIYPLSQILISFLEEIQKKNRAGIDQETIQPANMRVWSDPFAPRDDN